MIVAIVGHGSDKFTADSRGAAEQIIADILGRRPDKFVSGRSPVGGIDVWAEAAADRAGIPTDIKVPRQHSWGGEYGFKERNLDIARAADVVHVIVVSEYPPGYKGRRFEGCYHCFDRNPKHVKSGACWTAWRALEIGKQAAWHII